MQPVERPVLLLICADRLRISRLRQALRETGVLPAHAPSVEAACSLLTQVQVDGCILCETTTPSNAEQLRQALEDYRVGPVRLYLQEHQPEPLSGWSGCPEAEVTATAATAFRLPPPPTGSE